MQLQFRIHGHVYNGSFSLDLHPIGTKLCIHSAFPVAADAQQYRSRVAPNFAPQVSCFGRTAYADPPYSPWQSTGKNRPPSVC